jgi:hypothetical protein
MSLHAQGTSCIAARAIERYSLNHEWVVPFRLSGRTWHGTIYSWAHGHTSFRFQSGPATVWLTRSLSVS